MADQKTLILVADDDAMILELAYDVLSSEFDVIKAVDGLDAWEKASALKPRLVITDLMMPRMHGYELCEKLKGPGGVPGVKIIVASSKPFSTDKEQAEASGADFYLVKPYMPLDLLKQVRRLLAEAGGQAAEPARQAPAREAAAEPAQEPQEQAGDSGTGVSVRFWGTRGSCPVSTAATARYGGNTACTEVRIGGLLLIIDCGTGLRELGNSLLREYGPRPISAHIFVGHTHWDHIQGFPFFTPLYNPRNNFSLYSVHGASGSLESVFSGSMASDYFPIPLVRLSGNLRFVEMTGPVKLGQARVSFCHLNHPGICIGFRIEARGKVITYLSDHENFVRLNGDSDLARRQDAAITEFAAGSDLLIREAQYTETEYASRKGWGHSTYGDAVKCALDAKAARLAVFHHDPDHTDDFLDARLEECRAAARQAGSNLECVAAMDGLKIEL